MRVEWLDSMSQPGWGHYDPSEDMRCESIGFLIASKPDRVVLALNHCGDGVHGDYITIPRSAVRRVTYLR